MSIAHIKIVFMFLMAVLAAMAFWGFVFRGFAAHHADNPAVQGAAVILN